MAEKSCNRITTSISLLGFVVFLAGWYFLVRFDGAAHPFGVLWLLSTHKMSGYLPTFVY